jgi:hypothetical protein
VLKLQLKIEDVFNVLYSLYQLARGAIQFILENTIARANPTIADKFADATTMLITITAIWIIFEFVAAAKKVVKIIVVLGWILLIASMAISLYAT